MGEIRDVPGGAGNAYERFPSCWRVDAIAWLGELMHQEIMGEPCKDNAAFLAENPCEEYWPIGHDFDVALATLVARSVLSNRDSAQMAREYLEGLKPPAWSHCAKYLETGLARGNFEGIEVEIDPSVFISLQRLVDDIPSGPWWEKWGEIPGRLAEDDRLEMYLRDKMVDWLMLTERAFPEDLTDAIRYMEKEPPEDLWKLGSDFDLPLLRRLAVGIACCEDYGVLNRLEVALCMSDNAKDASLVYRLILKRKQFLELCGSLDDFGSTPESNPAPIVQGNGLRNVGHEAAPIQRYGRDCPPAELWAEAVSWLGELMYQVVRGEPYEDEGDFLSNNPCDRLWAVGRDFDVALATLVVDSVVGDPDPCQVAQMYLDGLVPPEWSACGRFLKEGLAEGDFHDIGIEMAPNMTTALQRLVNDIPLEAWRRWGEISTEHPEDPVYLEMDRWLDGLEKCTDLSSAISYMEMHPPRFWSLGWKFDRELFRRLAVEVAFCGEIRELERLTDALDVPFTALTESWIEWNAGWRRAFLMLCKPEEWDERDWAFAFGRLVPWIESLGELEEFLKGQPCSDAWWREREFDRVVATGLWEAVDGCVPDPDEVESMLAMLEAPPGTLTYRVKRFLNDASDTYDRPRYLGLSLGDALDEFDRAAGTDSTWAPEGMRYHMEMLVAALESMPSSIRDAVLICHRHPASRYWAFGREFDRGIFEQLSDLIDEDGDLDEVLALGDALEPPTGSDTWALFMVRLKDMAQPGTSWRDLVRAHPWIGDAHWSAAKEERAHLWYDAYCWCERLVMQVRGVNPPCESLKAFFYENPADAFWELGDEFDNLVTSQLVERYQKLEPVGTCLRADPKTMTIRMVKMNPPLDGNRRKGRDEVASIAALVKAPAGTLTESWLVDVQKHEAAGRECPSPEGLNELIRLSLVSEWRYPKSYEDLPIGTECCALSLIHTKMLKACRGSDHSLLAAHSEDADIAADAANWLEHFREIEVAEDNLVGAVRYVLAFPPGRFWVLSSESFDIPLDSCLMPIFKCNISSSMLRMLRDELMAPKGSMTYDSISGYMEAMKEYEEAQQAEEYEEKLREMGEDRESEAAGSAREQGVKKGGASCPANKNMILDEAPRGVPFDTTTSEPSSLPRFDASAGSAARAVSVPAFNSGESRGEPAANGSHAGRISQPAQGRKPLKTLGVVALVLIIAAIAFTGYARWHDERLREEHEAYMASLERLDRGELEAAMAANAEINEAFIKSELTNDEREDALAEDVEILSIDLQDGELISGFVNATCTVRGLSSGVVYEVDLGLRDDGVVKYVFGHMVADERFE